MGRRHTKEEMLAGALAVAHEHGLSSLTFGRVARALGISDRMVVYYFPSKDALIGDVLVAMGGALQTELAEAFAVPVADHREAVRRAWPVLARPGTDPTFALFFEAMGLAAAGREPYRTLVPQLVGFWIDWLAGLLTGDEATRRVEAEAAVSLIDGLLLLRHVVDPEAADRAAAGLGLA